MSNQGLGSAGGGFGGLNGANEIRQSVGGVFISHSSTDAALAAAFASLIQDITAGLIPTYSSSSKDDGVGIPYGDDWFKWIQDRIRESGNVVALITPESVGKPWILFEAGFGKAIDGVKVFGVRLGISGEDAYDGPFKGLQNSGSTAEDLIKLCRQLFEGRCNPREETVRHFVELFLRTVEEHFEGTKVKTKPRNPESEAVFGALEEIKQLARQTASTRGEADSKESMRFAGSMIEYAMHEAGTIRNPGLRVAFLVGLAEQIGQNWITPIANFALRNPAGAEELERLLLGGPMMKFGRRLPFPPDVLPFEIFRALCEFQNQNFGVSIAKPKKRSATAETDS